MHIHWKRFTCNFSGCSAKFYRKSHLVNHQKRHCQEKRFSCISCKKLFVNKQDMSTHHRRIHLKEKRYKCNWPSCNKSFFNLNDFNNHTRRHTGEKPFKCSWPGCAYSCTCQGNLRKHKKKHINL